MFGQFTNAQPVDKAFGPLRYQIKSGELLVSTVDKVGDEVQES
jgi:hypothetical protein